MDSSSSSKAAPRKSPYLLVYNASLMVGWAYVLFLTATEALKDGKKSVYEAVELPLKVVQTAAILEVVHSAIGLVRSPVLITGMQVASRIWILWGVIVAVPSVTKEGFPLFSMGGFSFEINVVSLMSAWSLSEIIRYGFFAAKEIGTPPYIMLWLRYTGFIILYPIGVSSELTMLWFALPTIKDSKMWCLDMPNAVNFSFDYYIFCLLGAAAYLPGFPQLYFYMLKGVRSQARMFIERSGRLRRFQGRRQGSRNGYERNGGGEKRGEGTAGNQRNNERNRESRKERNDDKRGGDCCDVLLPLQGSLLVAPLAVSWPLDPLVTKRIRVLKL